MRGAITTRMLGVLHTDGVYLVAPAVEAQPLQFPLGYATPSGLVGLTCPAKPSPAWARWVL